MYKFNILIIGCLFILGGCASALQKQSNETNPLSNSEKSRLVEAKLLYQLGREYYQKKEYAEAIHAYEQVIERVPENFEAYNNLGVIYSLLGENELGIQFIGEAIKLAPPLSYLHNNFGYALLQQGRNDEAAGAFERALQLDPANLHARNNLKATHRLMGCTENELCGQWQDPKQP